MAGRNWRGAHWDDRPALNEFICTSPAKMQYERHRGRFHPAPWELEAQSAIRDLRVPVQGHEQVLIGEDEQGLAAACYFGFVAGEDQFMIHVLGVAMRARGQGYGSEAVRYTMEALRRTKVRWGLDCGVFTRIDPRNEASRHLFTSAGFEYLDVYEGYEVWVSDV